MAELDGHNFPRRGRNRLRPRDQATEWQARTPFMACEQRGSMLAWSLALEAVGMITAYTAKLTPCWQPKFCGHQQTGYMTVQAIFRPCFGGKVHT